LVQLNGQKGKTTTLLKIHLTVGYCRFIIVKLIPIPLFYCFIATIF